MTRLEPNFVCIDVANGYSTKFLDFVRKAREKYPEVTLVGGNIVTREMVEEPSLNGGLDICKVGIGPEVFVPLVYKQELDIHSYQL